jgi:hypothetical protein
MNAQGQTLGGEGHDSDNQWHLELVKKDFGQAAATGLRIKTGETALRNSFDAHTRLQ